jgi:bifunctional non-homologous end joining protein LigD
MTSMRVGRRTIEVSKLDKVLFPDPGYTKRDLIDYYEAVADTMLPHVRDHLMTLERYPDGIDAQRFYSKEVPKYFPSWIDRKQVRKEGGKVTHVVCNEKATLVYLANQAVITPHVSLYRASDIDHPDQLMFDLDPSDEDFEVVRTMALELRSFLDDVGLYCVVKTSGSRGLHLICPLDAKTPLQEVRAFARDAATAFASQHEDVATVETRKAAREGRLFVDWIRNSYAQHAVAPYGVRARPGAPVAVPLAWEEVEDRDLHPRGWSIDAVKKRIATEPDPWSGWRRRARSLGPSRKRLDRLLR